MLMNRYFINEIGRTVIAVLIALTINKYYSLSGEYWMILAAFLTTLVTVGTPVKQVLIIILVMMAAVIFGSFLLYFNYYATFIIFIAGTLLLLTQYLFFSHRFMTHVYLFLLGIFTFTLGSLLILYNSQTMLGLKLFDIAIGGVIGVLCNLFVFSVSFAARFKHSIVPFIDALVECSHRLSKKCTHDIQNDLYVEKIFVSAFHAYPEWVYEVGFNPGLRSGVRFFMIKLERLMEAYFSMNYFISRIDIASYQYFFDAYASILNNNARLLIELKNFFQHEQGHYREDRDDTIHDDDISRRDDMTSPDTNELTNDIDNIEKILQSIVPAQMASLSSEYATLMSLVYDVRDVRKVLLQLLAALPDQ